MSQGAMSNRRSSGAPESVALGYPPRSARRRPLMHCGVMRLLRSNPRPGLDIPIPDLPEEFTAANQQVTRKPRDTTDGHSAD